MIDATIIKAHQHSAGARKERGKQAIGKSVCGNSTKIHATVDSIGSPLRLELSEGQVHDSKFAKKLVDEPCDYLLADKGYDTNDFRAYLEINKIQAVIPWKKNRKEQRTYDRALYEQRNIVERFFCRIKQFRRIATRYDKIDLMYKGGLFVVAIFVWLQV